MAQRDKLSHEVTRLSKSKLKGGGALEAYKVRNSRGSFLMAFTETDLNMHMIYRRGAALNLSEDFSYLLKQKIDK